jgi:ABC-type Fe3+-siderophore transport system permease subunit
MRIVIDGFWPVTPTWAPSEQIIILKVRSPRILLATSVNSALAVPGTLF